MALVAGLIGVVLSGLHLATATGAIGTGSGSSGAIVVGLIGMALGGLALARARRLRGLRVASWSCHRTVLLATDQPALAAADELITISTRRLLARPSAVWFGAIGACSPRPTAVTRSGATPRWSR